MKSLELAKKRAEHGSVENLKDRTFKYRLTKDYNKEQVRRTDDMDVVHDVIIQTSRLSDAIDYKKISAPVSTELKPGDIVYWEREATNWLIYLRRSTEKNYFLGEMREAQYRVKWRDEYGNVYSQLGSFSRQDPSIVKSIGYITTVDFQYLDGTATIMMQDNKTSRKLKRYNRFILDGVVWEVSGYDTTTYKNIIVFYLRETEKNIDTDDEDLPEGKIERVSTVETNFDDVESVEFDSLVEFKGITKVNGMVITDKYKVAASNAIVTDDFIYFNEKGLVEITVVSETTGAESNYLIEVTDKPVESKRYEIIGPDVITTSLSYDYKIQENINGSMKDVKGDWTVISDYPVKTKVHGSMCSITARRMGEILIICELDDGTSIEKEVYVKSLMEF